MKLTVLIDNFVPINQYFLGEPGLSFLIEDGNTQVLFDTGYSDVFLRNADKMNVNMLRTNYIIISHGHNDHTGGLVPLMHTYAEAAASGFGFIKPALVTHPQTFDPKSIAGAGEIGSPISINKLKDAFELKLTKDPFLLTERLIFLGEIERSNDFENQAPLGTVHTHGTVEDDYVLDDSALAYKSPDGLVIITGCSHAGLCNIIEHAKTVCEEDKVCVVIGGFHLIDTSNDQMNGTLKFLQSQNIPVLYPCHCVDQRAKCALSTVSTVQEMGVGISLDFA